MKIVFDPFYKLNENVFSYDNCKNIIGGSWYYYFSKFAQENNLPLVFAEKYLKDKCFSSDDVYLSEGVTSNTPRLLNTSATPLIIYSGESPNIHWKFYSFIDKNTKPYKYAMLFSGAKEFINKSTIFVPFLWPNDSNNIIHSENSLQKQLEKKKLAMIVSKKKQGSMNGGSRTRSYIKKNGIKILSQVISSMKLHDLYSVRMAAIKYFSNTEYFQLYGKNWENLIGLTNAEIKAVEILNPVEVDSKYKILAQYKFALCFENCVYPGYITEKIFDCFFAKCIPIYYGAPDISEYVPKNTFIDFRDFSSFDDLHKFLQHISIEDQLLYLKNIDCFLKSNAFKRYTDEVFSDKISKITLQYLERNI
jgi:hypothetical protein